MSRIVLPTTRQNVYRSVIIPMAITTVICALTMFFATVKLSYSLLLGGGCWFVPQLYVAYKLFHQIETNAKRFITVFFRTEITKLILVAALFIAIIKLVPVNLAGCLAGYICTQLLFWVVAAISK